MGDCMAARIAVVALGKIFIDATDPSEFRVPLATSSPLNTRRNLGCCVTLSVKNEASPPREEISDNVLSDAGGVGVTSGNVGTPFCTLPKTSVTGFTSA
ncbi:MAG TPA: hypothetical protein PKD00_05700, partial [Burkholderiales bacterium]|nr:hypothetical protein [Burkholderiales bacterium]